MVATSQPTEARNIIAHSGKKFRISGATVK